MTRRHPSAEPRVQRPIPTFMAYPARQQPAPDSAWRDALVVGLAIAFLMFVYLVAPLLEHAR